MWGFIASVTLFIVGLSPRRTAPSLQPCPRRALHPRPTPGPGRSGAAREGKTKPSELEQGFFAELISTLPLLRRPHQKKTTAFPAPGCCAARTTKLSHSRERTSQPLGRKLSRLKHT